MGRVCTGIRCIKYRRLRRGREPPTWNELGSGGFAKVMYTTLLSIDGRRGIVVDNATKIKRKVGNCG